jgi:hypothetical protein
MSTIRLGTAVLVAVLMIASSSSADAACGDKGGPGYRDKNGKCQSWEALGRVCGSPPTTRCTPEKVAPEAGGGAQEGDDIQEKKKRRHEEIRSRGP